ncbi:MAG: histidine phosphatase family protein [Acidimicrobiales bacterium]
MARHGRTGWNAAGRYQGQADPPLDRTGRAQAERLAAELVGFRPAFVLSSDLRRARDTAAAVAGRCGLEPVTDPALREVDLGGWEGLDPAEAARRYPDEYRAWSAGEDVARGGGETLARAGARAAAAVALAVDQLARRPGDERTAVVVTHGLVLQGALSSLAGAGRILLPDGGAPHLANGAWLAVTGWRSATTPGAAQTVSFSSGSARPNL